MKIIGIILYLAFIVLIIVSFWKVYTKAGKPGWACIIPIYSTLVLLEIVGKPWWWLLLMLIPIVNIVFLIWMINLLSKSFGKGVGFTIGLLILPIIFVPILGLGSATYQGAAGK
jgi:hypothetical protein